MKFLPILATLALLLPFFLPAQPGAAAQEFRPVVRQLGDAQKRLLLDYMESQGADLDRLIAGAYEGLSAEARTRTRLFAKMLQEDAAELPRTRVQWDRDTAFFGALDEGLIVLDSFRVTNTGAQPYLIRSVAASCDCTVLSYTAFPVMPGETVTLRVEFDSRSKAGLATPGIIVYDNSAPNGRSILYLHGEVIPIKGKPGG
jgi:hypothetical protein